MIYPKAIAVGIVTAFLLLIVAVGVMWLRIYGFASTGSGSMSVALGLVMFIVAVGFSIGFGSTLIQARAKPRRPN
jgi:hypothetical protein